MADLANPVEVGQVYLDTGVGGTAEVEQIYVDEDGETQVRVEVRNGHEASSLVLVDVDTFIERISDEELVLDSEPNWRG